MRLNKHGIRILKERLTPLKKNFRRVVHVARSTGWVFVSHSEESRTLIYERRGEKIKIFYSTMTIATSLEHPKKGKTKLFRRNVNYEMLWEIFKDPRVHTDIGYYLKK